MELPDQAATWLVAAALSDLDGWADREPNEPGCCPVCCAPCAALLTLAQKGLLNAIARPYANCGGVAWWDDATNRVDRGWLARSWGVNPGCAAFHDNPSTVWFGTADEWSTYLASLP